MAAERHPECLENKEKPICAIKKELRLQREKRPRIGEGAVESCSHARGTRSPSRRRHNGEGKNTNAIIGDKIKK